MDWRNSFDACSALLLRQKFNSSVSSCVCNNLVSSQQQAVEQKTCRSKVVVRSSWRNCGYPDFFPLSKWALPQDHQFIRWLLSQVDHYPSFGQLSQSPLSFGLGCVWPFANNGCSFQILWAFQPFSMKSFSLTTFCFSIKTIFDLMQKWKISHCYQQFYIAMASSTAAPFFGVKKEGVNVNRKEVKRAW